MKESAAPATCIYNRYQNMAPDDILSENPGNFAVNSDEAKSISIGIGYFIAADHTEIMDAGKTTNDTISIHTTRGKLKLTFTQTGASADAKQILSRVFGKIATV